MTVAIITVTSVTPSWAAPSAESIGSAKVAVTTSARAKKALRAINAVDSSLVDNAASADRVQRGKNGSAVTHEGATTAVSADPSDGYTLTRPSGTVGVKPRRAISTRGEQVTPAIVSFTDSGATTVPILRNDGSLQINTVIETASAPQRYSYDLQLPTGGKATLEGGIVIITNAAGEFLSAVAPAWAKDAQGRSVPTHYELDGATLTQVVEHSAAVSYPVVADPWFGIWLFDGFRRAWHTRERGYKYTAALTPWGWAVYTGVATPLPAPAIGVVYGNRMVRWHGWNEWKQRMLGQSPPATMEQQYACHVVGGYNVWKAGLHWDLETWRPSKPDWLGNMVGHGCNW
ncbi:MAG: hypothetical protein QM708_08980 [Propioniciclava sp.]|uniref:hypothetical protein n=1 Tax=Propioniciclava sp. TaxID=2038686 RepID=UPI0039E46B46